MNDRMIRLAFYGVLTMIITLLVVLPFCALTDDVEAHHRPWHRPQPTATQMAPTATQRPATLTRTPTATPTPVPPTATPTLEPGVPLPPPLPSPPVGIHYIEAAVIMAHDYPVWAPFDEIVAHVCENWEAIRYWMAEQTGYTVAINCRGVVSPHDWLDFGSWERWLGLTPNDKLNGCTPHARDAAEGRPYLNVDEYRTPDAIPDPAHANQVVFRGEWPPEIGQGADQNSVALGVFRDQLGLKFTVPERPGVLTRIWLAKLIGGDLWAGGGSSSLPSVSSMALIGDVTNRYSMLKSKDKDRSAYSPCAWWEYHDHGPALGCGTCETEDRGVDFHEAGHAFGFDSHGYIDPVCAAANGGPVPSCYVNHYIGSPNATLSDVQKICLVEYLSTGGFLYDVADWTQGAIATVSLSPEEDPGTTAARELVGIAESGIIPPTSSGGLYCAR